MQSTGAGWALEGGNRSPMEAMWGEERPRCREFCGFYSRNWWEVGDVITHWIISFRPDT